MWHRQTLLSVLGPAKPTLCRVSGNRTVRSKEVPARPGSFRGLRPEGHRANIQEERVMKIIHWIGIDDHADKWTIAHFKGSDEKPANEFELAPDGTGYRKLIQFAKDLVGEVRIVYEAGPCGY